MGRRWREAVLLGSLAGCGADGGGGDIDADSTCALVTSLMGDVAAELDADGLACLTQVSVDAGIDVEYFAVDDPDRRVGLAIADITKGATGSFPARVSVLDVPTLHTWSASDCTVTVTEHAFQAATQSGAGYRVHGTGACPAAAVDDAAGSVTIAPFEFVVVVSWSG